jgi:hypothetical protein
MLKINTSKYKTILRQATELEMFIEYNNDQSKNMIAK